MADLQCSPRGVSRPLLKYLFDTTREVNSFTAANQKRIRIIFYARVNTQSDSKAAVAILRYYSML
jgi:hypothetical protein